MVRALSISKSLRVFFSTSPPRLLGQSPIWRQDLTCFLLLYYLKQTVFCKETHFGIAIHGFVWFVHWLFMIWHAIHGCNCPFIGASIRFSSPRDLGNVFLKEGIRFRKRADEELSSRWIQIALDTIWDFCNFGQLFCYFALKIDHFLVLEAFGPFSELQIVSEGLGHRKILFPTSFYHTNTLWLI